MCALCFSRDVSSFLRFHFTPTSHILGCLFTGIISEAVVPAVITCPTCSKEYRWKPELAGKRVKCKCGEVIAVPASQPEPEANDLYDLADDGSGPAGGHG